MGIKNIEQAGKVEKEHSSKSNFDELIKEADAQNGTLSFHEEYKTIAETEVLEIETSSSEYMSESKTVIDELTVKPDKKYRFQRSVGRGGMKTVLAVRDKDTAREVAMAVIPDAKACPKADLRRFIQEARITAQLEHPNIVPVHDIGVDAEGAPYFTMKLLKGDTLVDVLDRMRNGDQELIEKYSRRHLLRIWLKVAEALAFAHSQKIVHLDLKPENVQLGAYGEVLVIDWGLAIFLDDKKREKGEDAGDESGKQRQNSTLKTLNGVVKGTPGYMAPEQAAGRNDEKDQRTDIYALGALLYTLLTLHTPVEGDDYQEILYKTVTGKIRSPKERFPELDIPSTLDAVVTKAMAVDPDDRYQTVVDMRRDIYSYLWGFAAEAEQASLLKHAWLFIRRHSVVVTFLSVIFIILMAFGGYALYNISQKKGSWVKVYDVDFTKPNAKTKLSDFKFFDPVIKHSVPPFPVTSKGLLLKYKHWVWLKNILSNGNTRVVMKVKCDARPDALEVCLNSDLAETKNAWFTPEGYSFQFAGYQGKKDLIRKNSSSESSVPMVTNVSSFVPKKVQTLVFERHNEEITMRVNGTKVMQAVDLFPLHDSKLTHIGFRSYTDTMQVLSLEVYRQALPKSASPLIAGDSLLSTGHIRDAVNQYLGIAGNYPKTSIAEKALVKAYSAAVTLDDNKERARTLLAIKQKFYKEFPLSPYRAFIIKIDIVQKWREQQYAEAFKQFQEAFELAPNNQIVMSILQLKHTILPKKVRHQLLTIIAQTRNITNLNISQLGIEDLTPLKKLKLESLDCSHNQLKSLKGVEQMGLLRLNCSFNNLTDLTPISNLPLKELNCSNNRIESLAVISKIPLKSLDVSSNPIKSIAPLANSKLQELLCSRTAITTLESITTLPLRSLDVSYTGITSIKPLEGMALRRLNISHCPQLESISPLKKILTLEKLITPSSAEEGEGLFKELPNLYIAAEQDRRL